MSAIAPVQEIATSVWNFRLSTPEDAPAFSRWVSGAVAAGLIDQKDVDAGLRKNNPTVLFYAAEKDGVVVAFAPVYFQFAVPHLGINPDANADDRKRALQVLTDGVSAMAAQFGIREIVLLTKPEYNIAQWGLKHGFDLDSRQTLKLNLNPIIKQGTIYNAAIADEQTASNGMVN